MVNFQALLGVVVGGAVTYANTAFLDQRRQAREARNLAIAFRGELIALREIVSHRDYLKHIADAIENIKQTNQLLVLHIPVRRQYFNVFDKNADKLGTLNAPLPELLATFYVQANAALEDMESIREGMFSSNAQALIGAYENLRGLLTKMQGLGEKIIAEISRQYP